MTEENPPEPPEEPLPNYGSVPNPPPGYYPPPPPQQHPGYPAPGHHQSPQAQNAKALWSMILGIMSVACCGFGFVVGIPAIILALLAKKDFAATPGRETGEGMATAGLVLGLISIALFVMNAGRFVVDLASPL